MRFSWLAILVPVILPVGVTQAQQPEPADYFPLEIGNEWTYIEILFPPFAPPDTLSAGHYSIVSNDTVNDTLYYSFDVFPTLANQFRGDGHGKFWGRIGGKDQLIFDFTLPAGQSYTFSTGADPLDVFTVTVDKVNSVDVSAGHFDDVIMVWWKPILEQFDSGGAIFFAPGIGPIRWWRGSGSNGELHRAVVSGSIVTETEHFDKSIPSATEIAGYPNPFSLSYAFSIPTDSRQQPVVNVFDMMGRLVERLNSDRCDFESCAYRWTPVSEPNGMYLVSATTDRRRFRSAVLYLK